MSAAWTFGRKALAGSLIVSHIWGSLLILAVFQGKTTPIIEGMFSAVGIMIGWNLAVLVGGKAWKDFIPLKFGGEGNVTVTKTETEETKVEK